MKNIRILKKAKYLNFAIILFSVLYSCSGPTTKEDVKKDLKEANEAIQEAAEATEDAMESKEDYYRENREEALKELAKRSAQIDKRILELSKTSDKSKNIDATAGIQTAIKALQKEKSTIDERMKAIKNIEKDWSSSYENIDSSITRIEAELDKLVESLENN